MPFTLASLLIQVSADIKSAAQDLQTLKSSLSDFKDVMKTAAGVMLGEFAHDALGAMQETLTEASDHFISLESTLTNITAAMGLVGEAAVEMREELARVVSNQTDLGYTAAEAAQALESLVKAGLTGEEAANALRAALSMARLEGISTEKAANLLVATLNQFGMTSKDAGKALDILVNASVLGIDAASNFATGLSYVGSIAHQMGLSIEDVTAALVTMNNAGIDAASAGRYLASMLTDMINNSDKLGFSIYDSTGKMKSLSDIVLELNRKLNSFATQAERDAYLTEIFGAQGRRAVATMAQMSNKFEELIDKIGETGTATMMVNEIMNTTAGRLAKATAASQNASLGFGSLIADLQEVFASFTMLLGPIGGVANALGPSLLQGAVTGLTMNLPLLGGALKGLGGILVGLGPAGWAVGAAIAGAAALYATYQTNFMGMRDIVDNAIAGIQKAFNDFLGAAVDFGASISSAFRGLQDTVTNAINYVISNPLEALKKALFYLATGGLGVLYDAWREDWFGMRDILGRVAADIQNMLGGLTNAAQNAWNSITSAFTNFGKSIVEDARRVYEDLVGGSIWTDLMHEMVNETSRGLNEIQKYFSRLPIEIARLKNIKPPAITAGFEPATTAFGRLANIPGAALTPQITINIDVHDNRISDEIDESDLARKISEEMIDGLRRHGVIP